MIKNKKGGIQMTNIKNAESRMAVYIYIYTNTIYISIFLRKPKL